MDVKNFPENVDLMSHGGFKLTEMESSLIENSLTILQSANKFQETFFVGRIETSSPERYYIAFGYRRDVFKDRKIFYSLNGHEWMMLPDVKLEMLEIARKIENFFTGDPAHIEEVYMAPEFVSDDDEVFVSCAPAVKTIKEEDRLSCIVHLLLNEAAIVPRGVLYLQINRCVTFNPFFRGLTRCDATQLKNFQFLRLPRNNRNENLLKREDYNYLTDFFDSIDDAFPANSFDIKINDRDICVIRSIKWPGMIFMHKLETKHQGFFYFGYGHENLDVLFMMN